MGSATPIVFPEPLYRNTAPNSSGQPWVALEDAGSSSQAPSLELELRIELIQRTRSWKYVGVCQKCPKQAFQPHVQAQEELQLQETGIARRIHGRIQTIILPFSLTRWYAGGRGRRLAKPGHRCLQTSDGGTRQSLAWLVGLRKFSRHNTHLLEKNRTKDGADPLQPPQGESHTSRGTAPESYPILHQRWQSFFLPAPGGMACLRRRAQERNVQFKE